MSDAGITRYGPGARDTSQFEGCATKLLGNTSEELDKLLNSEVELPQNDHARLRIVSGLCEFWAGRETLTADDCRDLREKIESVRRVTYHPTVIAHLQGCERRLGVAADAVGDSR